MMQDGPIGSEGRDGERIAHFGDGAQRLAADVVATQLDLR